MRAAHHPRPRRGREARRPGRHHRPRPAARRRHARPSSCRPARPTRSASGRPPGLDTADLGAAHRRAGRRGVARASTASTAAPTPATVAALTAWLAEHDLPLADLRAGRQRLEDVFLRLTAIRPSRRAPEPGGRPSGRRRSRAGERSVRAYAAQTRSRARPEPPPGRAAAGQRRHPAPAARVLLARRRAAQAGRRSSTPVDFLTPGILALAIMSTRHGEPRHRHRLRAPVQACSSAWASRRSDGRRLVAAKITHGARRPGRAGRRDRRWSRWRSAGEPGGRSRSSCPALVLGTAAFAGLGLLHGGHAARARQPRRAPTASTCAAAARRHGHPAREAAHRHPGGR